VCGKGPLVPTIWLTTRQAIDVSGLTADDLLSRQHAEGGYLSRADIGAAIAGDLQGIDPYEGLFLAHALDRYLEERGEVRFRCLLPSQGPRA
jgi:hypothetical protein